MKAATPPFVSADTLEYGDTNKLACLLCSRQFKALDQLRRHTAESDLHKARLSPLHRALALLRSSPV